MADTVESLAADIARLEAALHRALAIGASTTSPTGTAHSPQPIDKLEAQLTRKRTRLARLQALEADQPPFQARAFP